MFVLIFTLTMASSFLKICRAGLNTPLKRCLIRLYKKKEQGEVEGNRSFYLSNA
jgi:hypothetical protein